VGSLTVLAFLLAEVPPTCCAGEAPSTRSRKDGPEGEPLNGALDESGVSMPETPVEEGFLIDVMGPLQQ
jgi:hypothetical protein